MTKLIITKIKHMNMVVIKQEDGKDFFISAPDAIVISIPNLAFILQFVVMNGYMSPKVLEGILEEYNSTERTTDDPLPS
jgi:hypothetical protein